MKTNKIKKKRDHNDGVVYSSILDSTIALLTKRYGREVVQKALNAYIADNPMPVKIEPKPILPVVPEKLLRAVSKAPVEIYTDGSCSPNPGPGGWGVVVRSTDSLTDHTVYSGACSNTTNNQMEMLAVYKALKHIQGSHPVVIYTDSQYVVNGLTKWCSNWKRNGWTRNGEELVNAALWQRMYELYSDIKRSAKVEVRWLRGHAGNEFNEMADRLANAAREKQISF